MDPDSHSRPPILYHFFLSCLLPHHNIVPFGLAMLSYQQVPKNWAARLLFALMHGLVSPACDALIFFL